MKERYTYNPKHDPDMREKLEELRYTRLAPDDPPQVESSTRLVHYTFSDESVGRDGFVVNWDAWQVENFKLNPVFLWMHLDEEPPIGKVLELEVRRQLRGSVQYAETEFADTIFQLVKGRFLNGVSTSWLPIESVYSDKPGITRVFTKVDLLEISQVGIPSLPSALAARSHSSINLAPLRDFASRALDRNYRGIPRLELEAIYRAARPRARTRSERLQIAEGLSVSPECRQIIDEIKCIKQRVRDEGIDREDAGGFTRSLNKTESDVSENENVREAHGHLQRALRRHRDLSKHHDELAEEVGNLTKIHRALATSLGAIDDKGVDVSRAMKDFDRCARAIRTAHTGAEDAADAAGEHVDKAADCLSAFAK